MIRHAAMFAFFAAAGLAAAPGVAAGFVDPVSIDRQVAAFAGAGIGEPGGARAPVDRRLRLQSCAVPLDLGWYGGRRDSVLVRCPVADGWRIFVPVMQEQAPARRVLIERRDVVRVEAEGRGFAISRVGEAMEQGGAGDWIRVRIDDNSRRGTMVSAQISPDGRVVIPIR